MTLRWGILATGTIAHTFAAALQQSQHNELVAVGSRSASTAHDFMQQFPSVQGRAHASYEALLADPEVDAVYISTPHPAHARWAIAALRAGKHVLCEKPMGLNHAESMLMIHEAQAAGRFLMEAFMYQLHPQTRRVLQLIDDGAIGEARHLSANFGYHAPFDADSRLFANHLAGGGIMDVGCYPASLARAVFGSEPIELAAHGRLGETRVDEWSSALLKFEGGASAQIATAVSLDLDNSATIYGSKGRIHVPHPWLPDPGDGTWQFELHQDGHTQTISGTSDPLYVIETDHVAGRIRGGHLQSDIVDWQSTAHNALLLDRWRAAIGLEYEQEQPAHHPGPVLGTTRVNTSLPRGRIKHLNQQVSRLVMGCDNQPSMSHASVMWDNFIEAGGNCFDTAFIYGEGKMEQLLGHWHSRRGIRDEIVIIGKGAHTPHNFPEHISEQLTVSLERLQTDHVDLYFLHRDNLDIPVDEFVDALNQEVARGRIRAFGGSNWSLPRVQQANAYAQQHALQGFSAVSNHFSLARMREPIWPGTESSADEAFMDYLTDNQLALMPWSSQARGFFTPWADQVIADAGRENLQVTTMQPTIEELKRVWFSQENFARRDAAGEIAARLGVPMINVALAYVLQQPFPTFPLIGPRMLAETHSCIDALGLELSAQDMDRLNLRG